MKLLTPTEIKNSKETELARDILKTKSIKDALDSARTELNQTNALFDVTLSNQKVKWVEEEEKAHRILSELNEEIERKTAERNALLTPIELVKQKADNKLIEAERIFSQVKEIKDKNIETSEILQNKIDDYSEKLQNLDDREKLVINKEIGASYQIKQAQELSEKITLQMQGYVSEMEVKEKDFNERKLQLDMREQSIQSKELDLSMRETKLAKDMELVKSQRAALQAALQKK